MALTKPPAFTFNYVDQPDILTGDAATNKTKLDSRAKELREYLYDVLVPALDIELATKETPAGAQTKADQAESDAKAYADEIAQSKANTAESSAKSYADNALTTHLSNKLHIGHVGIAKGSSGSAVTTSTSYVDVPDMSLTFNTSGGDLFLSFTTNAYADVTGTQLYLIFSLSGTNSDEIFTTFPTANQHQILSMQWLYTSVAAGTYTLKVRCKVSANTGVIPLNNRRLIVMEVKR